MCAPRVTRYTSIRYSSSSHTRVNMCGKVLNIVSMCAVSPVVHTSNISSCKKKSCGCEKFHYGRSSGFLVVNVCNHGEHYETFYICIIIIIIIIIGIQPLGRSGQRPELNQATDMALVRCFLGKFLGVACHCFPPLFLDVPTFHHQVLPRPPRRERSQRRNWELWARMFSGNFVENDNFHAI